MLPLVVDGRRYTIEEQALVYAKLLALDKVFARPQEELSEEEYDSGYRWFEEFVGSVCDRMLRGKEHFQLTGRQLAKVEQGFDRYCRGVEAVVWLTDPRLAWVLPLVEQEKIEARLHKERLRG